MVSNSAGRDYNILFIYTVLYYIILYYIYCNIIYIITVLLVKKGRQQRYREQHREELKQLEAERRKSKQNVPFQPTSSCSDFNSTEYVSHNENPSEK